MKKIFTIYNEINRKTYLIQFIIACIIYFYLWKKSIILIKNDYIGWLFLILITICLRLVVFIFSIIVFFIKKQ